MFNAKNKSSITYSDVKSIVVDGESQTVEFKKSLVQFKAIMETLCAFLNSRGGIIVIGVNQHGKLIGQDVTDKTQQEIANEIAKIEPFPSSLDIQYVSFDEQNDRKIIVISTEKGDSAPYTYDARAFYRNQSSTMRMPQSRYSQLLLERGTELTNVWEMQLVERATVDDLDWEELQRTIKIAVNVHRITVEALNESTEDILLKLNLMRDNKLTNAAMILFAKSVMPDFPQCMIKMARFKGKTELGDFIDSQMVHGNAFQIMKVANQFIMRHLPVASSFDETKLERTDKPTLPVLAIREALSNAVCHRDYSIHNAAITLAIFDDRMEIWNNGILPSRLSLDDLEKTHKSYPRNRNIANVFFLRNYIETWGTGTIKMIELCQEHGVPRPVFDEYSGGFSVTLKFEQSIGPAVIQAGSEVTLNTRQKAILALIRQHGSMSTHRIIEGLDTPPTERMIRNDLNLLKKYQLIHLQGYGRSALWVIGPE